MFTFAPAFENETQMKHSLATQSSDLWKDLHKDRSSTRSMSVFFIALMGEHLRTVQFLLETNKGENTFKFWSFVLNRETKLDRYACFGVSLIHDIIIHFNYILQCRVWSWLRMNASYRLNTCKSQGNVREACFPWWRLAHGWVTRIQPSHDHGITRWKTD